MTDEELAYLFHSLPFPIQHYFGGDPREFLEGLRAVIASKYPPRHVREALESRLGFKSVVWKAPASV